MTGEVTKTYTAFGGQTRLATGRIHEVALAAHAWFGGRRKDVSVAVFDDETGQPIDLDLRGESKDVLARLQTHPIVGEARVAAHAGPGRPRLGVVCREISLLPRHWEWLQSQPGSTSAALRRLVEEKMKEGGQRAQVRRNEEAAYPIMHAIAGDFPRFEVASRALFAHEYGSLREVMKGWPSDIRAYISAVVDPDTHATD